MYSAENRLYSWKKDSSNSDSALLAQFGMNVHVCAYLLTALQALALQTTI